ncbi:Retrovirus-related Pol polyprotein from transposon RE1 [Sesamum angolense]|uniref:Retrovirus-related Pol polyprotein from transposon RE1 n=1 Tax=Sesamum angolense TaxID=2727404 RepID=A0AAE1WYJ2_9LAMI|nr:Retrovirus-related Pol polyprotein from transposon RE1 [Sesamum angolense]
MDMILLPAEKRVIDSKWVFKLKLNPDDSVNRYEARLVAMGYNQIEETGCLALLVYVDDILPTSPSQDSIADVKRTIPEQNVVVRLLYLGFTRPDISYSVQQLSQFLQHPTDQHLCATLHVVRYLKGSPHTGLFFPSSNSFQLVAYTDADWASCVDTRRSVTGYCIFLGSTLVS